jgi:hypothetical protein
MCLHKPTTASEIAFMDYVRVAITSARLNAPSLAPYVLYMHSEGEAFDPVDDNTTGWLKAMGVHVYNWRLSFLDQMPPRKRWMERSTGICKMDIPLAAHRLQTELAARGLDVERVVMTDVDVLFAGDFTFARWPQARSLPTFAAGIEFFSKSLNSGVVYFNVTTFMQERAGMLTYAVARGFNFLVADQSWLQEWFDPVARKRKHLMHRKLGWLRLDETVFNARPFVHPWPGHPRRARPLRCALEGAAHLALARIQAGGCGMLAQGDRRGHLAVARVARATGLRSEWRKPPHVHVPAHQGQWLPPLRPHPA